MQVQVRTWTWLGLKSDFYRKWTWLEYSKMWWTWTWLDLTFFEMNYQVSLRERTWTWLDLMQSHADFDLTWTWDWLDLHIIGTVVRIVHWDWEVSAWICHWSRRTLWIWTQLLLPSLHKVRSWWLWCDAQPLKRSNFTRLNEMMNKCTCSSSNFWGTHGPSCQDPSD